MTELQGLIETDRLATLSVNGSESLFWDGVADLYTSVIVWIPLAIFSILLLIRNVNPKRLLLILILVAMTGKDAWEPSSSLSYGVSVNVPLDGFFPWSSGKLNVQTAEETLEKLKMTLEQTRTQTTLTVKNSYNSILQNITQLELLEKNEELTQKAYEMSKNAYNMGSTDLLSLQQAEDNLYSARYNVQNQKYTILTSILTLEDTLGLPYGTLGK